MYDSAIPYIKRTPHYRRDCVINASIWPRNTTTPFEIRF